MSSHAVSPRRGPARLLTRPRLPAAAWSPAAPTALTVAIGAALAAVALGADGGQRLERTAVVELALILGAGVALALAVLTRPHGERLSGGWAVGAFAALAALTAASVTWAVDPAAAWLETNRAVAYLGVFAAAAALARLHPGAWRPVVGGILLAAAAVSAYAVATKVFPAALNPVEPYARLREPFGYWNAVGLMGALGVPCALWLGSRRDGRPLVSALAYPAMTLLVLAMLLSYSRGSLIAAAVAVAVWLALVPRRVRSAAVLGLGALPGVLVAIWAFAQDGLSTDQVVLAERSAAGLELGLLVVAVVGIAMLVGLAVGFVADSRPLTSSARRRVGRVLVIAVASLPLLLAGGLALSEEGLGGSVSEAWTSLTDPAARTPANDPGRLTAVGSVRARYWDEALNVFAEEPLTGVGAGGYASARDRFATDELDVQHAHGYVPQVLADLGLLGLAASLLLLGAWALAAWRTLRGAGGLERRGLVALLAVAAAFGVHSLVDWTWFVPGTAVVGLLAAGWLAGRGPGIPAPARDPRAAGRPRIALAAGLLAASLLAAWVVWQPLRAHQAVEAASVAADERRFDDARRLARIAADRNPLSVAPLFALANAERAAGRKMQARESLVGAVRRQPTNAETWTRLADLDLELGRPRRAMRALERAVYLDPRAYDVVTRYLVVRRQVAQEAARP